MPAVAGGKVERVRAVERGITVGIMQLDIAGRLSEGLRQRIGRATERFTGVVSREPRLRIESFTFEGPVITADENGYRVLDFVQVGLNEKTERQLAFLLVITDVEIAAASLSYLLALPS